MGKQPLNEKQVKKLARLSEKKAAGEALSEKEARKLKKLLKRQKKAGVASATVAASAAAAETGSGKKRKREAAVNAAGPLPAEVAAYREANSMVLSGPLPGDERGHMPFLDFASARAAFPASAHCVMDLTCKGFKAPSPIQAQAWPAVLTGRDFVGIAATGSGKTLGFVLPAFAMLLDGKLGPKPQAKTTCSPRCLVLAPTRELAIQSAKVAQQACDACPGLSAVVVYGGQPKWQQKKQMSENGGADFMVATPGRLLDFAGGMDNRAEVSLGSCGYLVLDEADRMLDMGFEKEVRKIVAMTAPKRQTVMFSATWPEEIREIASDFMTKPARLLVGSTKLAAAKSVKQHVMVVEPHDKDRHLLRTLKEFGDCTGRRVIVFALYKKEAARVCETLMRSGYRGQCVAMHGDMGQAQREVSIASFTDGSTPLLVATDVAARGLDIKGVELVINYTFPLTIEDYVHRIGRTGRAGQTGVARTFFTQHDKGLAGALQNILRGADVPIPPELAKFGNTVKKKEHKLYGAHFKKMEPGAKSKHVKF